MAGGGHQEILQGEAGLLPSPRSVVFVVAM
jgi:hypothetical protein